MTVTHDKCTLTGLQQVTAFPSMKTAFDSTLIRSVLKPHFSMFRFFFISNAMTLNKICDKRYDSEFKPFYLLLTGTFSGLPFTA